MTASSPIYLIYYDTRDGDEGDRFNGKDRNEHRHAEMYGRFHRFD
jgi:hypothetical protein